VIFFVKDKTGEINIKSINLNQFEIDFIPSFNISNNTLNCSINTSQENLEFAFYLYLNKEKVRQRWYSENNFAEFEIEQKHNRRIRNKIFHKR
jgi:hypothetical protein